MYGKDFNWEDYINLAESIYDNVSEQCGPAPLDINECRYRTVISRAYYGVYCSLRNHIKRLEPNALEKYSKDDKRGPHQRFIDYCFDKYDEEIGYLVENLRDSRNEADYDNIFPHNINMIALQSIFYAKQVLDNIIGTKRY